MKNESSEKATISESNNIEEELSGELERKKQATWYWLVQDLIVDIFGKLVPGVVFTVLASISVTFSVYAIMREDRVRSIHDEIASHLSEFGELLGSVWVIVFLVVVFVSYVAGQMFYRLDIKRPDRKSFSRLVRTEYADGDKVEWCKDNLACTNEAECEYPYPFVYNYIHRRGFFHLEQFVTWGPDRESRRSRQYINLLKLRIRLFDRNKANFLAGLESNIRLMNTAWYAAQSLIWISVGGIVGVGFALVADVLHSNFLVYDVSFWKMSFADIVLVLSSLLYGDVGGDLFVLYGPAIIANGLVLIVALWGQNAVVGFFHQLRVREVLFVLEAAYYIKTHCNKDLFQDLTAYGAAEKKKLRRIQEILSGRGYSCLGIQTGRIDGETRNALRVELQEGELLRKICDNLLFIDNQTADELLRELECHRSIVRRIFDLFCRRKRRTVG